MQTNKNVENQPSLAGHVNTSSSLSSLVQEQKQATTLIPLQISNSAVWSPGAKNKIWLLVIGVGQYRFAPALQYATSDAEQMKKWFLSDSGGGIPEGNVRILLNEQATKENVLSEIDWIRRHAMPEDLVVAYFACHGAPEVSSDGQTVDAKYLVLYDSNPDKLFATGLPLDDLNRKLDLVNAYVQVVFLECCYTGSVGESLLKKTQTADLQIEEQQGRRRALTNAAELVSQSIADSVTSIVTQTDTTEGAMFKGEDVKRAKIIEEVNAKTSEIVQQLNPKQYYYERWDMREHFLDPSYKRYKYYVLCTFPQSEYDRLVNSVADTVKEP